MIVVGGGVMGCSTARSLARRGKSVVLLERWHVGHTQGSSHGRARIFRFSYPDPAYVDMAQQALGLWRALEEEIADRLVITTGGLDGGKRLHEHVTALEACGARFELLSSADVHQRWPFMRLPDDEEVLFQPDAGVVRSDAAWRAFADSARRHGAEVLEGARVLGIEDAGDGVRVGVVIESAEERELQADAVVVAAGSWARGLLETAGISLETKPTRETVAFFGFEAGSGPGPIEDVADLCALPTFVDWGDPSVYALPSPGQGIKVGEHIAGPVVDPDSTGDPNLGSIERLTRWIEERYPTADHRPHHAETCLYTVTPDENFVLERHGPVVVGSPCSGHGFKFAPLIGERLASLATS